MTRRVIVTALGSFTAAVEHGAIAALSSGAGQASAFEPPCDKALLDRLERELAEYACGERRSFDLPIQLTGTAFQNAVWQALTTIPYGETRTYGQIAAQIGRPKAVRAVGAACGKNPILLLVPCHRVIGADGSLTGFAAGLPLKRLLLHLERTASQSQHPQGETAS